MDIEDHLLSNAVGPPDMDIEVQFQAVGQQFVDIEVQNMDKETFNRSKDKLLTGFPRPKPPLEIFWDIPRSFRLDFIIY